MSQKTKKTDEEVEQSPDGHFVRLNKQLGAGAYKVVWLAFDTETGKEVAWNTVDLRRMPGNDKKRITSETEILKELHHPHIINFYDVWKNEEKDQICFATEIVTSGTLKEYIARVKRVKLKVIKKWCRQILTGLDYLHSHDPPIIHRDLKCDNIFINGSTGEIRIGDFGLSATRQQSHVQSVLGTPQFMAPELYEEQYTEKVDIYALGMCVLEMISKEYPYEECQNPVQIWRKVSAGIKPGVLARIKDVEVRAFIDGCLAPQNLRLSARELLGHPFLAFKSSDPREDVCVEVEPMPAEEKKKDPDERCGPVDTPTAAPAPKPAPAPTPVEAPKTEAKPVDKPAPAVDKPAAAKDPHADVKEPVADKPAPAEKPAPAADKHGAGVGAAAGVGAGVGVGMGAAARPVSVSYPPGGPAVVGVDGSAVAGGGVATMPPPAKVAIAPIATDRAPVATGGGAHDTLSPPTPILPGTQSAPERTGGGGSERDHSTQADQPPMIVSCEAEVEGLDAEGARLVFSIHFERRRKKQVKFEFKFASDTPESIASEMVEKLRLPNADVTARMIAASIAHSVAPYRPSAMSTLSLHSQASGGVPAHMFASMHGPASSSAAGHATPHSEVWTSSTHGGAADASHYAAAAAGGGGGGAVHAPFSVPGQSSHGASAGGGGIRGSPGYYPFSPTQQQATLQAQAAALAQAQAAAVARLQAAQQQNGGGGVHYDDGHGGQELNEISSLLTGLQRTVKTGTLKPGPYPHNADGGLTVMTGGGGGPGHGVSSPQGGGGGGALYGQGVYTGAPMAAGTPYTGAGPVAAWPIAGMMAGGGGGGSVPGTPSAASHQRALSESVPAGPGGHHVMAPLTVGGVPLTLQQQQALLAAGQFGGLGMGTGGVGGLHRTGSPSLPDPHHSLAALENGIHALKTGGVGVGLAGQMNGRHSPPHAQGGQGGFVTPAAVAASGIVGEQGGRASGGQGGGASATLPPATAPHNRGSGGLPGTASVPAGFAPGPSVSVSAVGGPPSLIALHKQHSQSMSNLQAAAAGGLPGMASTGAGAHDDDDDHHHNGAGGGGGEMDLEARHAAKTRRADRSTTLTPAEMKSMAKKQEYEEQRKAKEAKRLAELERRKKQEADDAAKLEATLMTRALATPAHT